MLNYDDNVNELYNFVDAANEFSQYIYDSTVDYCAAFWPNESLFVVFRHFVVFNNMKE